MSVSELEKSIAELLASLAGKNDDDDFSLRVMLFAVLKKLGIDDTNTFILSEAELKSAVESVKKILTDQDDKAVVSGLACRPLEANGDGLEMALFTGERKKMVAVTNKWQGDAPCKKAK